MTADQREQALAAIARIAYSIETHVLPGIERGDLALVRAALTPPPLPADLAEIQARADARDAVIRKHSGASSSVERDRKKLLALVKGRDAELAELRARPTLTAEEAASVIELFEGLDGLPIWSPEIDTLRTIAEGAGK